MRNFILTPYIAQCDTDCYYYVKLTSNVSTNEHLGSKTGYMFKDLPYTTPDGIYYRQVVKHAQKEWIRNNLGRRLPGPPVTNGSNTIESSGVKYELHTGMLPMEFMWQVVNGEIDSGTFVAELNKFQNTLEEDHPFKNVSLEHLKKYDKQTIEVWINEIKEKRVKNNDPYYYVKDKILNPDYGVVDQIEGEGRIEIGNISDANLRSIAKFQVAVEKFQKVVQGGEVEEIKNFLEKNPNLLMYLLHAHRDWRQREENRKLYIFANQDVPHNPNIISLEPSMNMRSEIDAWWEGKSNFLKNTSGVVDLRELLWEFRQEVLYNADSNFTPRDTFSSMLYLLMLVENSLAELCSSGSQMAQTRKTEICNLLQSMINQLKYDISADAVVAPIQQLLTVDKYIKMKH